MIETLLRDVLAQISAAMANETVMAGATLAVMISALAWIGFQVRTLPALAFQFVLARFTLTLDVREGDAAFDALQVWLAKHPDAKRSRRFQVVRGEGEGRASTAATHGYQVDSGPSREPPVWNLTPGMGRHFVRWRGRWVTIERSAQGEQRNATGARPQEALQLRMLGVRPGALRDLVNDVTADAQKGDSVEIYMWNAHGYRFTGRRLKRSLDTVHLEPSLKAGLLADIRRFRDARQWYADRGIPWRRGYLLEGPPGTGKSTLIFALASALDLPVYIVSPSMVFSDGALMEAMLSASGGVVVIEDFDAFKQTGARPARERSLEERLLSQTPRSPWDRGDDETGVTLSGLLNAIDGIAAAEGRILFLTSNDPAAIDPALLRPGRVDVRAHLGLAGREIAEAMFGGFFPGADACGFVDALALPMAPAAIQGELLTRATKEAGANPIGAMQDDLAAALTKDAA